MKNPTIIAGLFVSLLCLNFKDMAKVASIVGIYKITSPSGKIYIGQSWNIKHRWYVYRGSNSKHQPKLHQSFLKHGAKNHKYEIIHQLPNDVEQRTLDTYESIYIEFHKDAGDKMMNLMSGGFGGKHSQETKDKISKKQKGIRKVNSGSFKKGRKYTPSQKQCDNISKALKGRKLSQSNKDNLSKINIEKAASKKKPGGLNTRMIPLELERSIGRIKYTGYRKKRTFWKKGFSHSRETKNKISELRRGKKHSDIHRFNRSVGVTKWWAKRKEVVC